MDIIKRQSFLPEELRGSFSIKDWVPGTAFGGLVKDCIPFLPDELREELIDHISSIMVFESSLELSVKRANGKIEDYGVVSRKLITASGVLYFANAMAATASYDMTLFKFHGLGSGTNIEAATDQILQTELTTEYNPDNTRATGSVAAAASGNNATYTTVGTNTVDAPAAVTEHGLFTRAATGVFAAPANVMLDRSKFSVINLSSGDGITSTYTLTINSGG